MTSTVPPLSTQPGEPHAMAAVLDLEQASDHVLRGRAHSRNRTGRMFGGEIAGQAVMAAHHDVPDDRRIHSLHGYFLLGGDPAKPVDHHVDPTRDGGSFTTRTVRTVQDDAVVFTLLASFQRPEEGLEHDVHAPDRRDPDDSYSVADLIDQADEAGAERLRRICEQFPWEFRWPGRPGTDAEGASPRQVWFRLRGDLPADRRAARPAALTHASDLFLLPTALAPHGIGLDEPGLFMASLDHTIWFHGPTPVDEWLLYDMRSAWAGGGRALCRGRFWTTDGRLVATVAQEGLVRRGG